MLDFTKHQIWFTYGPGTSDDDVLAALLRAGSNGVRTCFSYGTPDIHADRATQVRRIANSLGVDVAVIGDLQGEKCRLGRIQGYDEIIVKKGQRVRLTAEQADPAGDPPAVPFQRPESVQTFRVGDTVIEGDGALLMKVLEIHNDHIVVATLHDGLLHPGRGVVVQDEHLKPSALTPKDVEDLKALLASGLFDAVAVSFVADVDDLSRVRAVMDEVGILLPIVAKIETTLGVKNVRSIAENSDAIIAARGDLAITMPWIELPASMQAIAASAQETQTPWIVATQIAEGLERFVFPTRAEICDLAHWFQAGATGAMVSYETAFGPKPVEAVKFMKAIISRYL